ncbi:hypothetical protein H112_02220 [Trichophyton rubrum D6]|uniref:Zn(2)-C6 fungal-type domain-containing protein n=2 Tax=Trichophyton TaxID=5550 RepID=A0A022WA54_TRIRU|nr:hypothetical protein H100_02220 [Trichophyton rubrum MR850]EZF44501.1 hypothetical protein H102_02216 [Trichophyton rubrum CBS 100081]EZF55169.1 hypothetical protein H103_02225 [Trichophyton rubrum CBS 288.86]EZF65787.1 hypothetical protein H104_02201 [Trichophyton rubrum CBS 289.86]EZF76416.1 hypothetical protein H105_02237 [Trichophyton soudanense CBS 452.61]EZF87064.1 hypothetical protein H110_02222 [Trichophyton rubrum MR1448]EZG19408.1 hypothetical protein H107_02295 [Trichophyton rub
MAAAYLPSMKIRKRYACDKCHNLKSKCMRTSEDNECKRCARLGLDCVYSAPLPLGRLRGRRRPNSSSKTAPSDDTSSYIASSEVSLSLGGNYTYQNSGGEEAQQNHIPSLHNSLSEKISSNNGRNYCAPPSRYYPDQGNPSLAMDIVTNNPPTGISNNQQNITDTLQIGDIGFQNIQTQLSFCPDPDLSATIPNSSTNESYPEVSYPEILSATDELVQIISTCGSEVDFRSDISQGRQSHYESYNQPAIAFPCHTSPSCQPLSFPIIISSYTNLLQIYDPVIADLYTLIQRLPSSSPSQQQRWHNSPTGVPLQAAEIFPGRLRVLSDTEPNVYFLVSLVSQSVERLQNATWGYLRMLFPEQRSQNLMHATGGFKFPVNGEGTTRNAL